MSDELKMLEQELVELHETIRDDKVAHLIELREMEITIELERAAHTREIKELKEEIKRLKEKGGKD